MLHQEKPLMEMPIGVTYKEEDGEGLLTFDLPKSLMVRAVIAGFGSELGRKTTKELKRLAERLEAEEDQSH